MQSKFPPRVKKAGEIEEKKKPRFSAFPKKDASGNVLDSEAMKKKKAPPKPFWKANKDFAGAKSEEEKKGEPKLQWRKITKRAQRSFSKNKEMAYLAKKAALENTSPGEIRTPEVTKPLYKSTRTWDDRDEPKTPSPERKYGERSKAPRATWKSTGPKPTRKPKPERSKGAK